MNKNHQKMIEKHGSVEAWKAWLREIASKGGKAKNPNKGFGSASKEQLREWQQRGQDVQKEKHE